MKELNATNLTGRRAEIQIILDIITPYKNDSWMPKIDGTGYSMFAEVRDKGGAGARRPNTTAKTDHYFKVTV